MAKKLILDCPDDVWAEFKKRVPRGKSLNDAVVDAIRDDLKRKRVKVDV